MAGPTNQHAFSVGKRPQTGIRIVSQGRGPGCRISGDSISTMWPSRTAGTASPAGSVLGFCSGHDLLAAPGGEDDVRAAATTASGATMRVLRRTARFQFHKHVVATGDLDQFRDPADSADQRRPIPRNRPSVSVGRVPDAATLRPGVSGSPRARTFASSVAPTSAPSVRIIARMPATSRSLNAWTATPARTRSATIDACRSEKVRTRSGSSARDFGTFAVVKAETLGFSRRTVADVLLSRRRRQCGVARREDKASPPSLP